MTIDDVQHDSRGNPHGNAGTPEDKQLSATDKGSRAESSNESNTQGRLLGILASIGAVSGVLAAKWIVNRVASKGRFAMENTSPQEKARADELITSFVTAREEFIASFRRKGLIDTNTLISAENGLSSLAARVSGAMRASALVELGTTQRLRRAFSEAIENLTAGALLSEEVGRDDLAFTAWMGVARAHTNGTSDHGAAATAYQRAADAARNRPTAEQRYHLATYRAELEEARGEVDAALVDGLQAVRAAPSKGDRFYAALNLAHAMRKKAESCDYRPLRDELTVDDGPDIYNACRRAVRAADAQYAAAGAIAMQLGWQHLADEANESRRQLIIRGQIIGECDDT